MTTEAAPRILLISTKVDIATDHVVLKLKDLGASFYRINTEDFPHLSSSSLRFGKASGHSWGWVSGTKNVNLESVRSVWFRRHRLPVLPPEVEPQDVEYCLREADWFLKGALYSRDSASRPLEWMSHPTKVQLAESKIYQLSVAQSLGFSLPETLISNDPRQIRRFFEEKQGEIVAKALRLGYFDYGDHQTGVFTSQVNAEDLSEDSPLQIAPVIYQELVPKQFDIRVTVVGERLFAAAIDSQSIPSASLDWRRTETEELPHYAHELPAYVKEACLKYVGALGLSFGALDLVLTPDNKYVFLEINPNGQWVWIEEKLGFPISEAIADWLFKRSEG